MILSIDCALHDVHVRGSSIEHDVLEPPWFLWVIVADSVVSREGLERTDLVPSCAQVRCGCRAIKSADISTNESYAEHVHFHDTNDRLFHINLLGVVVTKPLRAVLAHACKGTAGDNHRAGAVVLEPEA